MTKTNREDFFTLIHKAQRRELFGATVTAGTLDWNDPASATAFAATWTGICRMLDAHSAHEENHFLPLLAHSAPEITAGMSAIHKTMSDELSRVTLLIDSAVAAPSAAAGLAVYRGLSAFVSHYLLHLLEEETVVMPAIWKICSDAQLATARAAFSADQTPAGVVRSRRATLPAVTAAERETMLDAVRATGGQSAAVVMLDEARELLEPDDWSLLQQHASLSTAPV